MRTIAKLLCTMEIVKTLAKKTYKRLASTLALALA